MDLTVAPVGFSKNTRPVSFGMARFSQRGLEYASTLSDVYEPLGSPNQYKNCEFFDKKGKFKKAPFTKYVQDKFSYKKKDLKSQREEDTQSAMDIASIIEECSTTKNPRVNSLFIQQLIATKSYFEKLDEQSQNIIAQSCERALASNWNNSDVSDKDTKVLLEMAKPALDDRKYTVLCGVLQNAMKHD